jgi:hypothetical protein
MDRRAAHAQVPLSGVEADQTQGGLVIAFFQSALGYVVALFAAFSAGVILADFIKNKVAGLGK